MEREEEEEQEEEVSCGGGGGEEEEGEEELQSSVEDPFANAEDLFCIGMPSVEHVQGDSREREEELSPCSAAPLVQHEAEEEHPRPRIDCLANRLPPGSFGAVQPRTSPAVSGAL